MAGMFRSGRRRPTFDTAVDFIPINRDGADRLGGYVKRGPPEPVWGAWSGPSAVPSAPFSNFQTFAPPTDAGHECQEQGARAWWVEGGERIVAQVDIDSAFTLKKRAASDTGTWNDNGTQDAAYLITDANRDRGSSPRIVRLAAVGPNPRTANLPGFTPAGRDGVYGILIDTDGGQTLASTRFDPIGCFEWTRTYTPADPVAATLTFLADVKDVAAREAVVGEVQVASQTKSLIFAHATLAPLIAGADALAKQWKLRIGVREMDIVGVQSDWSPGRYVRLIAEDRR